MKSVLKLGVIAAFLALFCVSPAQAQHRVGAHHKASKLVTVRTVKVPPYGYHVGQYNMGSGHFGFPDGFGGSPLGYGSGGAPFGYGFGGYPFGYGYLGYYSGVDVQYWFDYYRIPYYAKHPPVYYSYPVPRTYGHSPYAYPAGTRTPEVVEPKPLTIQNKFVPQKPSAQPSGDHVAVTPLRMLNLYVPQVDTGAEASPQVASADPRFE